MTRILIADDQALFREGLRTLLSIRPDMEVVGENRHQAGIESALAASRDDEEEVEAEEEGERRGSRDDWDDDDDDDLDDEDDEDDDEDYDSDR